MLDLIYTFSFSLCIILSFKLAPSFGLVDTPNLRKQHEGNIPLVGGIAVFLSLILYFFHSPNMIEFTGLFLACIASLVTLGVLDDRFDMPVVPRLLVQIGITFLVISQTNMQLDYAGNILGMGEVYFGDFAPIITVLL